MRADNADQRLTSWGRELGCVKSARWALFVKKRDSIKAVRSELSSLNFSARQISSLGVKLSPDGPKRSALDALSLTDFDFKSIEVLLGRPFSGTPVVQQQVKNDALYSHYISRQAKDIAALERDEKHVLPSDMDYLKIVGLSNELVQKLQRVQPKDVAQAGRIDGMTPAGLMLLVAWLKRQKVEKQGLEL